MNRRVLAAATAAVIAVVVVAVVVFHRIAPATQPASPAAPAIATVLATSGDFATRIEAQGRVGPPAGSGAKVAFAQPGLLRAVDVRVGDHVAAGTILAKLDRASLAAALAQAEADAEAASGQYAHGAVPSAAIDSAQTKDVLAQARLRSLESGGPAALSDQIAAQQAQRQAQLRVEADLAAVERAKALLAGGVIAAKDLQAAHNQLAADEADERAADAKSAASETASVATLRQARADAASARSDLVDARAQSTVLGAQARSAAARLATAQIAYAQGILRAPADGVVLAILKHPGEAVDPSTAVVEIGPAESDTITLTVPAAQARAISVGDLAQTALNASGRHTTGRVTAVVPAVDPATQSATVTVSGAPPGALAGDAVSAIITVAHSTGIVIPARAVVEDPQTGRTVVFVRAGDGSYTSRVVRVRASDDRSALIASGLRRGERVATEGAYELLAPSGG